MNPRFPVGRNNLRRPRYVVMLLAAASCTFGVGNVKAQGRTERRAPEAPPATIAPSLDEMRLAMGKWIETKQVVAKGRKDWQQGKEILTSRIELVKKEMTALEAKIAAAQASADKAQQKRDELLAGNEVHKAATAQLVQAVTAMEAELRRLHPALPEPVRAKVQPLWNRMPADPANVRVSAAERFQNVLGILGEVNKQNSEITVEYEVRTLAGGKRSEVQAIYIGLGQAYYVSADGDAGIGRPGPEGWQWEPSAAVSRDLVMALEILQGKHTPAFVPLPVVLQ
jgi:Protein of unknown function (DUF3450)